MWIYARHSQTLRCDTSGFHLNHNSHGVFSLNADVGQQFQTWVSVTSASAQNCISKFASESNEVIQPCCHFLHFHSAELSGAQCLQMIPFLSQWASNSLDINLPPLSSWIAFIVSFNWFLAYVWNLRKAVNVSLFFFMGMLTLYLVQSSMNIA